MPCCLTGGTDVSSTGTEVSVPTADGAMPALLWFPATADDELCPAVVVFQEIFGVSDYIQRRCAELADLGYAVLAPEFYWRQPGASGSTGTGSRRGSASAPRVPDAAPDLLEQGMALLSRMDWDQAVRDGVAATEHLTSLPNVGSVGLLGFCLGGGLAYATAAQVPTEPSALVSYYGSALPQLVEAGVAVDVPSLHHFGTADTFIPMEQVEAIRGFVTRVDADVRCELHEGAGHAFDNPNPMFHHARAAETAWAQTVEFLADRLSS
jgi:carboxymethylenebutenolidase